MSYSLWIAVSLLVVAVLALVVTRRRVPAPPATAPTLPIRLTQHAIQRMAERGVSRDQIETAVANPDRVTPCPAQGSVCIEAVHDTGRLKVWVVAPWPSVNEAVVKSTAWCYERVITIPDGSRGRLVGPGGCTVKALEAASQARISVGVASATVRADSRPALEHGCSLVAAAVARHQPTYA